MLNNTISGIKVLISAALVLWMGLGIAIDARADTDLSEAEYIAVMKDALNTIRQKAEVQPQKPISFSANLFYAHEAMIEHFPLAVLIRYADTLIESGVTRIDINPGLYPWLDRNQATIDKYDAVIRHIKSKGIQIALNPQYSPNYHKVSNLAEWGNKAIPVFVELAKRYQPDIFIVVHEPTTMAARMGTQSSPQAWKNFASLAAAAVKRVSPGTRVGAGGLYWEEQFYNAFLELNILDVMTIDIYNLAGLETYSRMIKNAMARGKPVYIEETWRPPYIKDTAGMTLEQISMVGVGKASFKEIDRLWLETITAYASAWGLESVTPFWTTSFFAYVEEGGDAVDPLYTRKVIEGILSGWRTETFHAYKHLIEMRAVSAY